MRHRTPNKHTTQARGCAPSLAERAGDRRNFTVYCTADLFRRVRREALDNGRTIAGQFRHMAEYYLRAQENGAAP